MHTITRQKPPEDIARSLEGQDSVYVIGCGTCATACGTGGKAEVAKMVEELKGKDKVITGWMVIPTACDSLTEQALAEEAGPIAEADAIVAMTCAFGAQTVARYTDKPVVPALDTLFVGVEDEAGNYTEVCRQCGECVLDYTGGICPVARCSKNLLNGPCGGSQDGMCEVDPNVPCAWQQIIERLAKIGRLDKLEEIRPPKNWNASPPGERLAAKRG